MCVEPGAADLLEDEAAERTFEYLVQTSQEDGGDYRKNDNHYRQTGSFFPAGPYRLSQLGERLLKKLYRIDPIGDPRRSRPGIPSCNSGHVVTLPRDDLCGCGSVGNTSLAPNAGGHCAGSLPLYSSAPGNRRIGA